MTNWETEEVEIASRELVKTIARMSLYDETGSDAPDAMETLNQLIRKARKIGRIK